MLKKSASTKRYKITDLFLGGKMLYEVIVLTAAWNPMLCLIPTFRHVRSARPLGGRTVARQPRSLGDRVRSAVCRGVLQACAGIERRLNVYLAAEMV